MDADTAIDKIKKKVAEVDQLATKERFCSEFTKWHREAGVLLGRIFGKESYQVNDFTRIDFLYRGSYVSGDSRPFENKYRQALSDAKAILTSIYEEIQEFGLESTGAIPANPLTSIELVLSRFHSAARQLRQRHSSRPTLDVNDEYDVQDLLHALLRIHFKDIRSEEWTPSYAGNSSRMDFLIHEHQIVIETKMTRKNLSERDVVDQLVVDLARYKEHPRCKTLVCFVYDPDGYIGNSAAIVTDLEKGIGDIEIRVFVFPDNN